MHRKAGLATVILAAGLGLFVQYAAGQTTAPKSDALPTAAELQAQADAGNYRDALRGLLRVLDLQGPAAAGYDRCAMLMLRAECQLQIRELPSAIDSFAAAHKQALADGTPEWAAKAGAMQLLLTRSSAFAYTPRTGIIKDPISILDKVRRPRVLLCLYADEMATVNAKYKAALAAKNLPPIMDFAKTAAAIRELELATSGNNDKTTAMFADLGKHAAELMNTALDAITVEVEGISTQANRLTSADYVYVNPVTGRQFLQTLIRRVGLTATDIQNLKGDIDTCSKFRPAAKELSTALGSPAATFDDAVKRAAEAMSKAQDLLQTDFTAAVH